MAFRPFGWDHLAVLASMGLVALGLLAQTRRLRRVEGDDVFRWVLGGVLVGNELLSWMVAVARGLWGLPLQLCDLAVFLMAWALIGRNRTATELAFCWGLAGSSQAILTPDLREGFPSYPWIQFFLGHCGVVLGAVFLAVRGRVRLTRASVWRVWLISNGYVAVVGVTNWILGTNFGYLARKPEHPSLLDWLGPWPYYLVAVELIALGLFFLCYGFSRAVDWWAGAGHQPSAV